MKPKHLFFDLDHTLWDFEKNSTECLEEIFYSYREEIPEYINFEEFNTTFSRINKEFWFLLDTRQISHEYLRITRFKAVFDSLGWQITDEKSLEINSIFLQKLPQKGHLIKDAEAVLSYLSANYQLHIVSNGYLDIQTNKLKSGGILHYFQKIITFDVAGARKPEKEIFEYALKETGAEKNEVIMIGDNLIADVEGANLAGIKAIHLDETAESNHSSSISSLSQLLDMY